MEKMDTQKALQAIEDEKQERIKSCIAKIEKILEETNCQLEAVIVLKAGQVIPRIDVISK